MALTTEQLRARAKIWRKKAADAKRQSVSIAQDMLQNADALDELAANREVQPVAWTVGGFSTHDKKWAERRSAEDNLLLEPLYRHPVVTGIDENHYDPELEPGLYVAEIMTKGGAAVINGYYTAPPAPAVPDDYQHLKNVQEMYHSQEERLFALAQRIKGVSFDKYSHTTAQAIDVLEREIFGDDGGACRAAMLGGDK